MFYVYVILIYIKCININIQDYFSTKVNIAQNTSTISKLDTIGILYKIYTNQTGVC